jgi:hypothetical protein
VNNWNPGSSFGKDPPNAVVDFIDPKTGNRESAIIVEITDAKMVNYNQILQLTVTQGNFRNTDERLGNTLKPLMRCVSVFIDNGTSKTPFDRCATLGDSGCGSSVCQGLCCNVNNSSPPSGAPGVGPGVINCAASQGKGSCCS